MTSCQSLCKSGFPKTNTHSWFNMQISSGNEKKIGQILLRISSEAERRVFQTNLSQSQSRGDRLLGSNVPEETKARTLYYVKGNYPENAEKQLLQKGIGKMATSSQDIGCLTGSMSGNLLPFLSLPFSHHCVDLLPCVDHCTDRLLCLRSFKSLSLCPKLCFHLDPFSGVLWNVFLYAVDMLFQLVDK